MDYYNISFGIN